MSAKCAGGLSWKRFDALGLEYGWLGRFLRGEVSRAEFRDGLLADIKRYAKRQMTWFKRNRAIEWHSLGETSYAVARATSWARK